MSTAIDDLRSMLDERHVKWRTDTSVTNKVEWTIWKSPWFKEVWAKEVDGSISIFNCSMTPEQAIAATLGVSDATSTRQGVAGTCKDVAKEGEWFECSECGTVKQLIHPNYCPNCGRRVDE